MLSNSRLFKGLTVNLKHFYSSLTLEFVPKHEPVLEKDFEQLRDFLEKHNKILVLTGAGISTESGIPDYRSEEVGLYARSNHKPISYQTYVKSEQARQRYWARNFIGWTRFSKREPNFNHFAIKIFEDNNKLSTVVTQNVDNLHFKAGSKNVIELHGTAYRIKCLSCENTMGRHELQKILIDMNPHVSNKETQTKMIRPDGDVEIPEEIIKTFRVPSCSNCNGVLKPDIVFFGDNVPRQKVELIKSKVEESDSVLVLGSSLSVFSSYRIILQAKELILPIAVINIGPTWADDLVQIKVSGKCGDILARLCDSLFESGQELF